MVKDADKPRGRMSAYAFFVQTCREEHKKKRPNENVVFIEFSRECAERWKAINENDKHRFLALSDKDKKRYEAEMANYKPKKGDGGRRKKPTKDPNAPKRPLSAFFWFCNDERPKAKASMQDATIGQVAKELGRRWNEFTEDQKAKYAALTAKDKARYEKELKAYKSNGGGGATAGKGRGRAPAKAESSEEEDDEEEEEDEDSDE